MPKQLKCELCGMPLDYTPGKPGRPPQFCPEDCRKLFHNLSWVEDLIEKIERRGITDDKKIQLRSRLFSMSNLLNYKK